MLLRCLGHDVHLSTYHPGCTHYWRVISVDRSDGSDALTSAASLGRRQFLRGIAATGAIAGSGGLLAACSGSSTSSSHAAASGGPKRGGDLKVRLTGGGPTGTSKPHQKNTHHDSSPPQTLHKPPVQLDPHANPANTPGW